MLSSVLKNLPKLKPAELEKVRQRVAYLLGTPPATGAKDPSSDWLLEGLMVELRQRGLWTKAYSVPAKLLPIDYTEKAEAVRQHLLAGIIRTDLRLAERMALGAFAGKVLANYLTITKVPVSIKTMVTNVEKVPVALEESFPGYWAGKLLGFCIKA